MGSRDTGFWRVKAGDLFPNRLDLQEGGGALAHLPNALTPGLGTP